MNSGIVIDMIYRALREAKGKKGFKELATVTMDGGDDCSVCITTQRRGKRQDWIIESCDVTEQAPETAASKDAEADRKLEKENQEADDELTMGRASGEH